MTSLRSIIEERGVFGCGGLHHLSRARNRERLIELALDAGFRRFDVAPAYGNGLAERVLGRVLRGIPGIKVRTKAGIPVRIYPAWSDRGFAAARGVDILFGNHRTVYTERNFSERSLRDSVAASRDRLRGLPIETLFLHEPLVPFSASEREDIEGTLTSLRSGGAIGEYGIAGVRARAQMSQLPTATHSQSPIEDGASGSAPRAPRHTCYALFRTYQTQRPAVSFADWIAEHARGDTTFVILTTTRASRLREWKGA